MMKKQILAAVLIGLGPAAMAQDGAPAPDEEELAVLPAFEAIDANEDGMIDMAEAETLSETLEEQHQVPFQFETADSNRDGLINGEEYVAYDGVLKDALGIA